MCCYYYLRLICWYSEAFFFVYPNQVNIYRMSRNENPSQYGEHERRKLVFWSLHFWPGPAASIYYVHPQRGFGARLFFVSYILRQVQTVYTQNHNRPNYDPQQTQTQTHTHTNTHHSRESIQFNSRTYSPHAFEEMLLCQHPHTSWYFCCAWRCTQYMILLWCMVWATGSVRCLFHRANIVTASQYCVRACVWQNIVPEHTHSRNWLTGHSMIRVLAMVVSDAARCRLAATATSRLIIMGTRDHRGHEL